MTASTEQERAQFEKLWAERPTYMGQGHQKELALHWWQAARRAPVVAVPQGWKLVPVEPTEEMIDFAEHSDREYSKRAFGGAMHIPQGPHDHWVAMIAAAPKPPEIQPKSCIPEIQTIGCIEAAPVQLPEPSGLFSYGAKDTKPTYHHGAFDKAALNQILDEGVTGGPHRCEFAYPESQVLKLREHITS